MSCYDKFNGDVDFVQGKPASVNNGIGCDCSERKPATCQLEPIDGME